MRKFRHDLSYPAVQACKLGRLQCAAKMALLPGDVIEGNYSAKYRFNAFEHHMMTDITLDLYAFLAPWRDAYELGWARGTWENWIRQDQLVLANQRIENLPGFQTYPGGHTRPCYQVGNFGARWDVWWTHARIWDFYFRDPLSATSMTPQADTNSQTNGLTEANDRVYGPRVGRLHDIITDMRPFALADLGNDRTVDSTTEVDLLELGQQAMQWRRVAEQNLENIRGYFRSAHRNVWGTAPSDYNDLGVPRLLNERRYVATVRDVVGIAGDEFGQFVGHSADTISIRIPRTYVQEHSWLWVFFVARLDPRFNNTRNPMDHLTAYEDISGDPDTYGQGERVIPRSWYDGNDQSASQLGVQPRLEHMRRSPAWVHPKYTQHPDNVLVDQGSIPSTWENLWIEPDDDRYDDFFQSTDDGHLSLDGRLSLPALRLIPPSDSDLYQSAQVRAGRSV